MGKILTAQIMEEIYFSRTNHGLFSEKQKGCRRGDVDRLYAPRKDGGRGLASIKNCVDASMTWRLHIKAWRKTNYSYQKQYWRHEDQENDNNQKTKWEEKQFYERFKRLISNISHEKTWTWLRKRNLKRETESLLIAAPNNTIRTIKARTQQNSKCRLCGDKDETINHIISECSKLA